ncbi:MAG: hypothetical protein V3W20_08325 [Candidatus Neomarinimicrobiota bacterium]
MGISISSDFKNGWIFQILPTLSIVKDKKGGIGLRIGWLVFQFDFIVY